MNKSLKDVADKMVDNKNQAISKFIDSVHNDIVESNINNTIPYEAFGAYFLDHFKYGGHMDEEAPLTLKWLELAGGPYGEVDIVDGKGNLIITTPGMFCRPDINADVAGINFNSMIDEYNLRSNRMSSDGINFANNALNGIENGILTEQDDFNFRWEAVFKRYESKELGKAKASKPVVKKEDIGFLDFD